MVSRLAILMAVVTMLAAACSSSVQPVSGPDTTGTTPTTLSATTSTTTSTTSPSGARAQDFLDAVDVIAGFASGWNAAGLTWVSAYADDAVSIDEYLRISYETGLQQKKLLVLFALGAKKFPQSMQDPVADLLENYQNRASAFQAVIAADLAADDEAWQAATDEYYSYSVPEATFSIVEELLATPEIAAAFGAEGIEIDDFFEAMKLAFGTG